MSADSGVRIFALIERTLVACMNVPSAGQTGLEARQQAVDLEHIGPLHLLDGEGPRLVQLLIPSSLDSCRCALRQCDR